MKRIKYKRIFEKAFIVIIALNIVKFKKDKKFLKMYENLKYLIYKQESVLKVYEKWVSAIQNKKEISDYLLTNNYCEIAIYGLGRLGKQLYEELIHSGINVSYIIDRDHSIENEYYKQVRCYHPEDKLPPVDMIIVTVPGEENEIATYLREKNAGSVKTMNDLLFVI